MFNGLEIETILNYLEKYGVHFLFVVMFLEHLNFPGLPAGIIMPAIGILISQGSMPFWFAILISVVAGVCGSIGLYGIGYYFGYGLMDWLAKKSKRMEKAMTGLFVYFEHHGNKSVLFIRLIPVARTIISLMAGASRLNLKDFVIYSAVGIFIWNLVLICLGYFFGYWFL